MNVWLVTDKACLANFLVSNLAPDLSNFQLAARKGLHRSLFSATKKWFGGKQAEKAAVTGLDMGGK